MLDRIKRRASLYRASACFLETKMFSYTVSGLCVLSEYSSGNLTRQLDQEYIALKQRSVQCPLVRVVSKLAWL